MDEQAGTARPAPAPGTPEATDEAAAFADRRIGDLRRRAARCDDQREQTDLQRSADSLSRLASALGQRPAVAVPGRPS